ncbi:MAG: HIT family protein [Candidatus Aenigmatarchaeota archaeon]
MNECLFCNIIAGKIPSQKIWEDAEHVALLDIFPIVPGQVLVIPKKHFNSYIFDMPEEDFKKLMLAAKKVGKMLDKSLNVERTLMVLEGFGVNHAHAKLYPNPRNATEGYLVPVGKRLADESLKQLADLIKSRQ